MEIPDIAPEGIKWFVDDGKVMVGSVGVRGNGSSGTTNAGVTSYRHMEPHLSATEITRMWQEALKHNGTGRGALTTVNIMRDPSEVKAIRRYNRKLLLLGT